MSSETTAARVPDSAGVRAHVSDVIELYPGASNAAAVEQPRPPAAPGRYREDAPSRWWVLPNPSSFRGRRRRLRAPRRRVRAPRHRMLGQDGMATAEYAIATLGAVAFAGLLVVILRSEEVRGFLLNIIRSALSIP
ncbi:DUF4244 domain-containing protein [Sinomonas sp. G460-2]|uniref:DUF4244 domain-containing protein n=1 Tax=Sinomonas sp. G460-2 TaxID=3393464 RepID=UPI0039EEB88F